MQFGHFAEHARKLGADHVATGHYARLRTGGDGRVQLPSPSPTLAPALALALALALAMAIALFLALALTRRVQLLAALDPTKDQSYFLAAVRQEGLARTLFPLGALRKSRVRELAAKAGLHVAAKRDSVGICFVGKRDFGDFIRGYLPQVPGDFVCVETGAVLGRHRGVTQYTPGQRARLSGSPNKRYVVSKDVATGTIVLCEGADHPACHPSPNPNPMPDPYPMPNLTLTQTPTPTPTLTPTLTRCGCCYASLLIQLRVMPRGEGPSNSPVLRRAPTLSPRSTPLHPRCHRQPHSTPPTRHVLTRTLPHPGAQASAHLLAPISISVAPLHARPLARRRRLRRRRDGAREEPRRAMTHECSGAALAASAPTAALLPSVWTWRWSVVARSHG